MFLGMWSFYCALVYMVVLSNKMLMQKKLQKIERNKKERGYRIHQKSRTDGVIASKYCKSNKCFHDYEEKEIVSFLIHNMHDDGNKPIIISTWDYCVELIDGHVSELKNYDYIANCSMYFGA